MEKLCLFIIKLDYAQLYYCPEPASGYSIASRGPSFYERTHYSIIHNSAIHSSNYGSLSPIERNYRYYQPSYVNGVSYGAGTVINFGRISPAAAHSGPLLATSVSGVSIPPYGFEPARTRQPVERYSSYSRRDSISEHHLNGTGSERCYGSRHSGDDYDIYEKRRPSNASVRSTRIGYYDKLPTRSSLAAIPPSPTYSERRSPSKRTPPARPTPPNSFADERKRIPADKTPPQYQHHTAHQQQQRQQHREYQQHRDQQREQQYREQQNRENQRDQNREQQQQQQQLQHNQEQSQILPQHDDSCEEFNHTPEYSTCFGKQRMMVSKLWTSVFPEFTNEHVHRHNFYLCQWQRNTQVRIVYLFYRWITAITCLAALVCSLLDVGRTDEVHYENHYAKWWIYLTHWGLLFCTVQAWLGAWIVTQGMMVEREDFEIMRQTKKSRLHHLYWLLYTCATVYSFIITLCYWGLVHNPEIHKIDTLNIMVHVFNSVIMLVDLAVVGHPIRLGHVYFTTGIGLGYAIFTSVYFLSGGTDRKNQNAIYPMLDWTKPGKAIIVTVCGIIFVFIMHFVCFLLYRARVWLFTKLCIRSKHNRDGDMGEGLNDDSSSRFGGPPDYSHQQQYPIVHAEQPHSKQLRKQHSQQHQHYTQQQDQHQHQRHTSSQPPPKHQYKQYEQMSAGGAVATMAAPTKQPTSVHTSPQYQPQYSGYAQQPVVAGVNVGVISAGDIYRDGSGSGIAAGGGGGAGGAGGSGAGVGGGTSAGSKGKLSASHGRNVAHLDASQREQFLNPNKIVEYKM